MKNNKIIIFLLSLFFLFAVALATAEAEDLEQTCKLESIEKECQIISSAECRELLEKCEAYYQEMGEEIEKDLSKTGQEKKTLQNKVYSLRKKIENLNYQIYESNLVVKDLGIQIEDTESSVEKTSQKIEDSKQKLANILQTIYEEDQKPAIEILLSGNDLSDFFDNLTALEILNSKNQELLQNIKTLKINLEEQKLSLDEEKDDLEKMVKIQTYQKQENSKTKEEQEYYLQITEAEYQKQLKEKQEVEAKAAEIRARIFELVGISKAPTFGEAYVLAKDIERITGVRPAFLLAVLTQESNIGKNVGQCYLKNSETGAGETIKTGRILSKVMKPTRDVGPFLTITKELGRDPYNTPVSCPMSYGWGGAMGPAQFIPKTWMIYRDRLKAITGKPGDPWDIKDAFLAAALYLSDYGAAKQNYDDEWRAAMIYFSGSTNLKFRFYGDSVIQITKRYENDIEKIK